MYGHSREVLFFETRVGLDAKDLCEAWALHNFGRLCLMRIRRQIRTSQKKNVTTIWLKKTSKNVIHFFLLMTSQTWICSVFR